MLLVLLLSSNRVPSTSADKAEFVAGLQTLCSALAEDIVRNGEGTQHVIKVSVSGAPSASFARGLGKAIVNSNLVKCAIAGCDPNVGRIVGAIGSYLSKVPAAELGGKDYTDGMKVSMGGVVIFGAGAFQLDPQKEKLLSDYMFDRQLYPSELPESERLYPRHDKCVEIDVTLGAHLGGSTHAAVIGSDLTKEYVEVNADYRS